jgi:putative Holliday junction resolvase
MRKMGIDYGSKRVGIALTDEGGNMAFPHGVLQNNENLLEDIVRIIEEKQVGEIVIGHSLDKEGKPNAIQERINELITDLTLEVGLPVHLQPEMFSTQEAIRFQGRTKDTDASAATIILNSFITKNK